MNESQAKRQLAKMAGHSPRASVLHLLADLHGEIAEEARQADDASTFRQHKSIEAALIVMGMKSAPSTLRAAETSLSGGSDAVGESSLLHRSSWCSLGVDACQRRVRIHPGSVN